MIRLQNNTTNFNLGPQNIKLAQNYNGKNTDKHLALHSHAPHLTEFMTMSSKPQ